jgi:hypothetical protein
LFKKGSVIEPFFHAGHLAQQHGLLSALLLAFDKEVGSPLALGKSILMNVDLVVVFWIVFVLIDHQVFWILFGGGFPHEVKEMEVVVLLGHAIL